MWAHAEYIKLLRSTLDEQVFDFIPEVAARYYTHAECQALEVWKPDRQVRLVKREYTLSIQAPAPFLLRWSRDDWHTIEDTASSPTMLAIEYVDIPIPRTQQAPIRFTFFWQVAQRWEGRDYAVGIEG